MSFGDESKRRGRRLPAPVLALAAGLLTAAAALLAGCGGSGEEAPPVDASRFAERLAGAPEPLASLYERGNEVIDTGPEGYEQAVEKLRGHPVVVNVWASWCGPCRAEFPHLREAALAHGKRVAFLGVDSDDSVDAARTFLRDHPLPYPSYTDPEKQVANELGATFGFPATVFLGRNGERLHTRHGPYDSVEDLTADIRRHIFGRE